MSALLTCLLFSASSLADKPDWAGSGKPSDEQKSLMKSHHDNDGDEEEEDKIANHNDKKTSLDGHEKGLEKQKNMKAEQVRKELDKGSETGKTKRAEHSKKWWKFWGEE
jgi:hypothetical protein